MLGSGTLEWRSREREAGAGRTETGAGGQEKGGGRQEEARRSYRRSKNGVTEYAAHNGIEDALCEIVNSSKAVAEKKKMSKHSANLH